MCDSQIGYSGEGEDVSTIFLSGAVFRGWAAFVYELWGKASAAKDCLEQYSRNIMEYPGRTVDSRLRSFLDVEQARVWKWDGVEQFCIKIQ